MSISEARFRAWCGKIGITDTTGLASFDLRHPAIQWLVENVNENNVVLPEDMSQYEEVISLGLDEPAVDEFHSNTEAVTKLEAQLAQLEHEINSLTAEVYNVQDVNKMLQRQQEAQSTHQRTLYSAHSKRQYLQQEEKRFSQEVDVLTKTQLAQLAEDVEEIAKLVSESPAGWLLQMAAADHIEFNEEVTQFLAAASSHINHTPSSESPSSALTTPSQPTTPRQRQLVPQTDSAMTTSTSGCSHPSMQDALAELDRLRWMYPISKQQRLSARCKAAESIAALQLLQTMQAPQSLTPDPARLRSLRQEALSLEMAVKELEGNHGIKQLWSEMQRIWDAPLHVAQYQRQLEEAQRLLESRRAKADVLVSVAACLELVAGVSEVEAAQLQKAYEVMQEVDRLATSFATVTQHRAARYTASKAALLQSTRSTLHEGDTWMHRLHQGLNPTAAPSLSAIHKCCKALSSPSPSTGSAEPLSATQVLSLLASSGANSSSSLGSQATDPKPRSGSASGLITVSSLVKLVLDIHKGRQSLELFINQHMFQDMPEASDRLRSAIKRLSALIFPGGDSSQRPQLSSPEVQNGLNELNSICEQLVAEINSLVGASHKPHAPEDTWEGRPVEHHVLRRFHTQPEQLHDLLKAVKLRSLRM